MAAIEKEKKYTADEFLAMTDLPERCELINGVIYYFDEDVVEMSAAPNTIHQRISRRIVGIVDRYISENKGQCEVFNAPFDVKLDNNNTVQPDILVVCDPKKIDEQKCNGSPDWIIEIVSPSSVAHDMNDKLLVYSKAGVREYWIVDPMKERVFVYLFGTPNITGFYTFDDDIPVGIYKDAPKPLSIRISEILA